MFHQYLFVDVDHHTYTFVLLDGSFMDGFMLAFGVFSESIFVSFVGEYVGNDPLTSIDVGDYDGFDVVGVNVVGIEVDGIAVGLDDEESVIVTGEDDGTKVGENDGIVVG